MKSTAVVVFVLLWGATTLAQDGGLLDLGVNASPITELDAGADLGAPDAAPPSPAARARSLCVDAVENFEAGRPRTALSKLKAAVRLSPNQFGVIVNLADYYKLMGPRESAITYYRRARDLNPRDLSVAGNLIDLLLTQNPPQSDLDTVQRIVKFTLIDIRNRIDEVKTEQQRLQRQRKTRKLLKANNTLRELNEHLRAFLRREIRWAMRARAHNEVGRIYEALSRMGLIQDLDDLALELGNYYRQIHQETNAVKWYRRVQRSTKLIRKAKKAIAEIEHQQSVREMGLVGRPNRLNDADAGRLSYGRELLSRAQDQRSIRNAVTVLQEVAGKKPLLWQVHRLLGRAYTSLGEAALAEQALLTAVALNPTGRDTLMSLAEFYETKQRWKSASTYFGRVLRLVPTDAKLQLRQSKVLEKAGWYSDALLQVNRALDVVPEDHPLEPSLQEQKMHLEGLAKPIANKPETTADRVQATAQAFFRAEQYGQAVKEARKIAPEERRPELWLLLGRSEWRRAIKYERRDQTKRARFAIERANKALENIPSANNETYCESRRLLAHLRERQQRPNAAIDLLKLAQGLPACGKLGLELELVRLELLVQVRPELPDWISDLLDFPYLWATYWRLSSMQTEGIEKQRQGLDELADERFNEYAKPLSDLLIQVRKRLMTGYVIAGSMFGPLAFWFFSLLRRRFRGRTLVNFLERVPSAQGDVHRILSAVRHEVLKHNTTALKGFLDGIEAGEEIAERAEWCRKALLGDLGRGVKGAKERLDLYVRQLEYIAQSHRHRLNLRYRDNAFGAVLSGFDILESLEQEFYVAETTGRATRALKRGMRRATERINGEGYRELIKLLQSLRGLTVTEEVCLKIFEGVRSERALVNLDISELRISVTDDAIPVDLGVARQDFEDMLRNPIRNAIQASHKMDVHGEVVIGLSIGRMLDPITGESWTEFFIKDRCPTMISDTLIHQRSIESGLGLMASLVSKYDGSVRVEAQPTPWTKAVVISLPCPENQQETWTV